MLWVDEDGESCTARSTTIFSGYADGLHLIEDVWDNTSRSLGKQLGVLPSTPAFDRAKEG